MQKRGAHVSGQSYLSATKSQRIPAPARPPPRLYPPLKLNKSRPDERFARLSSPLPPAQTLAFPSRLAAGDGRRMIGALPWSRLPSGITKPVAAAAAVVVAALASSFLALPRPPSRSASVAAAGSELAMSKARVYADVNVLRPKEYWDYEALTVQWGSVLYNPLLPFPPSPCS